MNATEKIQALQNEIESREAEIQLLEQEIACCNHTYQIVKEDRTVLSWCGYMTQVITTNERLSSKKSRCTSCGKEKYQHYVGGKEIAWL